jgi:hypothetical protein
MHSLVRPLEISFEGLTLAARQPLLGQLVVLLVKEDIELLTLVEVQNTPDLEPVMLGIWWWCLLHELKLVVHAALGYPLAVKARISEKIKVQSLSTPSVRVVPALVFFLRRVGTTQPDH